MHVYDGGRMWDFKHFEFEIGKPKYVELRLCALAFRESACFLLFIIFPPRKKTLIEVGDYSRSR